MIEHKIRDLCTRFIWLLLLAGCGLFKSEPDFYLGGIQLDEPNMQAWVDTLAASDMNTVSVSLYARQGPWFSGQLHEIPERDSLLLAEISAARSRNLHVVLIPRIALDYAYPENQFLWHGMILPQGDEEIHRWFARYKAFVLKWAKIAAQRKVDVFAIGSELNELIAAGEVSQLPGLWEYYTNPEKLDRAKNDLLAFEDQLEEKHLWTNNGDSYSDLAAYLGEEHAAKMKWAKQVSFWGDSLNIEKINLRRKLIFRQWRELIRAVRKVYNGKLTYAANFDNYYDVPFWPELDLIGINAYFKLRDDLQEYPDEVMLQNMSSKWQWVFAQIDTFRMGWNISDHPVIFTEIGYTFRKYSTLTPWTGSHFDLTQVDSTQTLFIRQAQPVDLQERAFALRALHYVHQHYPKPLLQGILYWNLSTTNDYGDNEPYTLHIGRSSKDPLLRELQRFR